MVSDYAPTGDQPEAIAQLLASIRHGSKHNTLLGVTGSGKTFTVANVISQLNRPTLVLSHNKTLAAQLYGEFKNFFPENAVEYFVSYYDYYQPEAYLPSTDTYIEKDLSINDEIEKMRLSTTATLLSGRRDVIVVSSVSCLYGCGNPSDFHSMAIHIEVGEKWVITSDKYQFILNEKKVVKSGKKAGEEWLDTIGYYPKINQLISGLIHHQIHGSDITAIDAMAAEIERVGQLCIAAIQGASVDA